MVDYDLPILMLPCQVCAVDYHTGQRLPLHYITIKLNNYHNLLFRLYYRITFLNPQRGRYIQHGRIQAEVGTRMRSNIRGHAKKVFGNVFSKVLF